MKFDVKNHCEYLTLTGSHTYGTNTPQSDVDVAGVFVPPVNEFLGLDPETEVVTNKEIIQTFTPDVKGVYPGLMKDEDELDGSLYSAKKFLRLLANNNPNILDIAFADAQARVYESLEWAFLVRPHLDKFLTKKVRYTFCSYATQQVRRIESHRKWLLNPPKAAPKREDFGLNPHQKDIPGPQLEAAHAAVQKRIEGWHVNFTDEVPRATILEIQEQMEHTLIDWKLHSDETKYEIAGKALGYETNFMELLQKERRFATELRSWNSYCTWKKERNKKRAPLEELYGFDTKHGMHTVRLLQACAEIFTRGTYTPRRANAAELVSIINGAWSFDKVKEYTAEMEQKIIALHEVSTLPKEPDWEMVNTICLQLHKVRLLKP
jgi:predicted nucleotidyltransferase